MSAEISWLGDESIVPRAREARLLWIGGTFFGVGPLFDPIEWLGRV